MAPAEHGWKELCDAQEEWIAAITRLALPRFPDLDAGATPREVFIKAMRESGWHRVIRVYRRGGSIESIPELFARVRTSPPIYPTLTPLALLTPSPPIDHYRTVQTHETTHPDRLELQEFNSYSRFFLLRNFVLRELQGSKPNMPEVLRCARAIAADFKHSEHLIGSFLGALEGEIYFIIPPNTVSNIIRLMTFSGSLKRYYQVAQLILQGSSDSLRVAWNLRKIQTAQALYMDYSMTHQWRLVDIYLTAHVIGDRETIRMVAPHIRPEHVPSEDFLQGNILHLTAVGDSQDLVANRLSTCTINPLDVAHMTPLHRAIQYNSERVVTYILKQIQQIICAAESGSDEIEFAVSNGTMKRKIADLVEAENQYPSTLKTALLESRTTAGETPLIMAINARSAHLVKHLLSAGASPNTPSHDGLPPWAHACEIEDIATLSALTQHPDFDPKSTTPFGETLFHYLALHSSLPFASIARPFMSHGLSISKVNANGEPPLFYACEAGNILAMNFMLTAGADPNFRLSDGHTPVDIAVNKNDVAAIQTLKNAGALIDRRRPSDSTTPLHNALIESAEAVSIWLIENGVDLSARVDLLPGTLYHDMQPLHIAAVLGNTTCALSLLDHGADPYALTGGHSPMQLAIENKDEKMVEALAPYVDINKRIGRYTPLEQAAITRDTSMIALLLQLGAKPNFGYPLHLAAESCNIESIRALLQAGCRPDKRNSAGKTPFEVLCEHYTPDYRSDFWEIALFFDQDPHHALLRLDPDYACHESGAPKKGKRRR